MKTKTILSIAIMAALPFGAHADPVGPAAVPANGTPVVATANAPYVTQTPTAADATHIASTAYVKGAYNDAIAAMNNVYFYANSVDRQVIDLQGYIDDVNFHVESIDGDIEDLQTGLDGNYHDLTGQIESLRGDMNDKRVEIYTTWDDDTAKQQVAFVNAQ